MGGMPTVAIWPAVAVELERHIARPPGVVIGGVVAALLQHRHRQPGLRKLLGGGSAAGAGSDHAGIDLELEIPPHGGAVDDSHLARRERAGPVTVSVVARRAQSVRAHGLPFLARTARATLEDRIGVIAEPMQHAAVAVVAHHRDRLQEAAGRSQDEPATPVETIQELIALTARQLGEPSAISK